MKIIISEDFYVELKTLLLKIKHNMKDVTEHSCNQLQVKKLTILIRVLRS
jgi:hypothetical protein